MENRFDYIIVGGGAAGSVLAARLSERSDIKVALVEAGAKDSVAEISMPLASMQLFKSKFDWDFESEPEPALEGRTLYIPRGKTLGGSTSINMMIYHRGNPADYSEWACRGATGWSYEDLLPYFIKSEGNTRDGSDDLHGKSGPVCVSDSRSGLPHFEWFLDAAAQAGHRRTADFIGASPLGFGYYQLMQRDGLRCSTAGAYLHPNWERRNLTVVTNTLVTRVIFDRGRAVGIAVDRDGAEEMLHADAEVILSAGTFGSAQLLLLSGIGPAQDLQAHRLPVVADLPVGENLQDHPFVQLEYLTDERTLRSAGSSEEDFLLFQHGCGIFTSNGAEAGGFISTAGHGDLADVQLYFGAAMYDNAGLMQPYDDALGVGLNLLKPSSRGKVSLRTARPDSKPRIQFNFLTTEDDRRVMIDGVKVAADILAQPSLRSRLRAPYLVPKSLSDDDIMLHLQRNVGTIHHPVGTCAIGSVVDSDLKVMGVDGLRVIDASIIPSALRGNTAAPVIAIAEKAADMLAGRGPGTR
ncbi:choline dehydrogenase [Rhizobium leguminosarum]|uniref:GMC family oxidoreductase n=1 Tax=Rhizobium TaxID=379 RepID=UPI0010325384|nr:GMC family oxidoreductase N-terminal domain-containing protein [Rhizobium leguminosarum]TBF87423.1 choline dehydrogenase [Rhizobium leguminosarum]TBG07038.1 choline dehydrogenase [Rhizobium leguminosarum]TBG07812.1 choline dehydrogenase [Rhizobium leguminosarum]TBG30729.1 choline dehydrogenase [Rhizobium leguminosarum]TBG50111.1 choline dehydrogenase [Rhizobium leguminosarum]